MKLAYINETTFHWVLELAQRVIYDLHSPLVAIVDSLQSDDASIYVTQNFCLNLDDSLIVIDLRVWVVLYSWRVLSRVNQQLWVLIIRGHGLTVGATDFLDFTIGNIVGSFLPQAQRRRLYYWIKHHLVWKLLLTTWFWCVLASYLWTLSLFLSQNVIILGIDISGLTKHSIVLGFSESTHLLGRVFLSCRSFQLKSPLLFQLDIFNLHGNNRHSVIENRMQSVALVIGRVDDVSSAVMVGVMLQKSLFNWKIVCLHLINYH